MRQNLKESLRYAASKQKPLAFFDAIELIEEISTQCGPHVEYETLLNSLEAIAKICKKTPASCLKDPVKVALRLLP